MAVRTLHATTFEVGVLTAMSTAAFLLVGLPAGAWVDRWARRRVMVVSDVGRLVVLGSVPVAYAVDGLTLAQLYAVALVAGVLTVFFDVAYQSYLPSMVSGSQLVEANAKLAGSAQVAQVGGPSLAGALVQVVGGPLSVAVDAASYGVSVLSLAAMRPVEEDTEPLPRRRLRAEVAEGLHFVFGHPILRAIAATTATSNLFSSMTTAVEVVFLVRAIRLQPGVIGLLFAAGGVGGVTGALCASALARRIGGVRATLVGMAMCSGAFLIPLTTRGAGAGLFAAGFFSLSFGSLVYNVNQVSFRQRLCPPRLLGRMNATMRFVVWGVMPIGALVGGALGTEAGLRPTLWIGAAGSTAAIGWLLASPMRSMRDFPDS